MKNIKFYKIYLAIYLLLNLTFLSNAQEQGFVGYATIDSIFDGFITKEDLLNNPKLLLTTTQPDCKLVEYTFYANNHGSSREIKCFSDTFSNEINQYITDSVHFARVIYFRNIKVKLSDSSLVQINPIRLHIRPSIKIDSLQFLPELRPTFSEVNDGKISKGKLLSTSKIQISDRKDLEIIRFDFAIPNLDNYWIVKRQNSDHIGQAEKDLIEKMKSGDFVHFSGIIAEDKDGLKYKLPMIILEIK